MAPCDGACLLLAYKRITTIEAFGGLAGGPVVAGLHCESAEPLIAPPNLERIVNLL